MRLSSSLLDFFDDSLYLLNIFPTWEHNDVLPKVSELKIEIMIKIAARICPVGIQASLVTKVSIWNDKFYNLPWSYSPENS